MRREGQLAPMTRQIYERQALLYAWMLSQIEARPVRAELILIAIGSDAVEREPLKVDFEALELAVRQRLNALLREFRREREAAGDRQRAALGIRFPHAGPASGAGGDRRGGRARPRPPRASPARGPDRPRQDRRRALPGDPPCARPRQAPLRPHRQEPAAGDGAQGHSPGRRRSGARTPCGCAPRRACAPTARSSATRTTARSRATTTPSSPRPESFRGCFASRRCSIPTSSSRPRPRPRSARSRSASTSPARPRSWSATTTTPSTRTSRCPTSPPSTTSRTSCW